MLRQDAYGTSKGWQPLPVLLPLPASGLGVGGWGFPGPFSAITRRVRSLLGNAPYPSSNQTAQARRLCYASLSSSPSPLVGRGLGGGVPPFSRVGRKRIELLCLSALDFESNASTSFATRPWVRSSHYTQLSDFATGIHNLCCSPSGQFLGPAAPAAGESAQPSGPA